MDCSTPRDLEGVDWLLCYMTTPKHMAFFESFGVVLLLLALVAPLMMLFGFAGALAKRSSIAPVRWLGLGYSSMIRGVPDIVFFLFVPIALDQMIEAAHHYVVCPEWTEPLYSGSEFTVCPAAKVPSSSAAETVHQAYNFTLALFAYSVIFGAFVANTIDGALKAVPRAQLETAAAYGMTPRQIFRRIHLPQMWRYALPGLSNIWQILIKSTPLLFLLGVQDIVFWAEELGRAAFGNRTAYPHPDWRLWYFLGLLIFYLGLTYASERGFAVLTARASRGQSRKDSARRRARAGRPQESV